MVAFLGFLTAASYAQSTTASSADTKVVAVQAEEVKSDVKVEGKAAEATAKACCAGKKEKGACCTAKTSEKGKVSGKAKSGCSGHSHSSAATKEEL